MDFSPLATTAAAGRTHQPAVRSLPTLRACAGVWHGEKSLCAANRRKAWRLLASLTAWDAPNSPVASPPSRKQASPMFDPVFGRK